MLLARLIINCHLPVFLLMLIFHQYVYNPAIKQHGGPEPLLFHSLVALLSEV